MPFFKKKKKYIYIYINNAKVEIDTLRKSREGDI